jgi:hypothetical protein
MQERRISIRAGNVEVTGVLNDSGTADLVWDALPITELGSAWGDEIYFRTEIVTGVQDGQEVVDMGALAYWPPGQAICLFFGPTPMSQGDEIRPASEVNVIGRIEGDPTILKSVSSGASVTLERI